ncbi:MAG: DUF4440 domain-containing protein [Anaerolineae bacterium]|nr:DUF4440 domain-containing protein [Anaerolineae bacterium]
MILKKITQFISASLLLSLLVLNTASAFAAPAQQDASCAQDYVIQASDWLSKVAQKQYGDVQAFSLIVEATNTAAMSDKSYTAITEPNRIEIGWKLCLPASNDAPAMTETVDDTDSVDLEAQVRSASAAWDEAFNGGDLTQLMNLYNADAVSMPPGLPALEGKDAIEADFEWFFDNFTAHHQTTIVDLAIADNLAVEHGQYTMLITPKDDSEPISETGKHIVVRKKSGDTWQVVREIWNTDE